MLSLSTGLTRILREHAIRTKSNVRGAQFAADERRLPTTTGERRVRAVLGNGQRGTADNERLFTYATMTDGF